MSNRFRYTKQGYDPAAADAHIAALEAEIASHKERERQVNGIVVAAQLAANEIIKDAEEHSGHALDAAASHLAALTALSADIQMQMLNNFVHEYKNMVSKYASPPDFAAINAKLNALEDEISKPLPPGIKTPNLEIFNVQLPTPTIPHSSSLIPHSEPPPGLTIEIPFDAPAHKLQNLMKMIRAKAELLKAALDTDDLTIKQTANKSLLFPWFKAEGATLKEKEAYSALVSKLCKTAIEGDRVTGKQVKGRKGESAEFEMWRWLVSLGFDVKEEKELLKVLLEKLEVRS